MNYPKTLSSIYLVISILYFSGCVYFVNPQPVDQANEKAVPRSMQGSWTENEDTFQINGNSYSYTFVDYFKTPKKDYSSIKVLDKKVYLLKSTFDNRINSQATIADLIRISNDSVEANHVIRNSDYINHDFILRQVHDGFILNSREGDWWNISLVKLDLDTITAYELDPVKLNQLLDSSNVIFKDYKGGKSTTELKNRNTAHAELADEVKFDYFDSYIDVNWTYDEWNKHIKEGLFKTEPYRTLIRIH